MRRELRGKKEEIRDAEELQTSYRSQIENLECLYKAEKKKNEERDGENEDEDEE